MTDEYVVKYLDDLAENNCNLLAWDMREAVRIGRDAIQERIERSNPQPLTKEEIMSTLCDPLYMVYPDGDQGWMLSGEPDDYLDEVQNEGAAAYRYKPRGGVSAACLG